MEMIWYAVVTAFYSILCRVFPSFSGKYPFVAINTHPESGFEIYKILGNSHLLGGCERMSACCTMSGWHCRSKSWNYSFTDVSLFVLGCLDEQLTGLLPSWIASLIVQTHSLSWISQVKKKKIGYWLAQLILLLSTCVTDKPKLLW